MGTVQYSTICIKGYQAQFNLTHGIHSPKITKYQGSDRRLYRQLFKGGDDIRQDAVMEDRESEEAGLIKFVTNTLALGATLTPLHANFLGAQRNASNVKRIAAFKELMKYICPAMRFWFMESQTCHQKWYEMRFSFTRTTAGASIVGHILVLSTEGVFTRCCGHTLCVLRENKDLVMTLIDVLKHDPLRIYMTGPMRIITEERARKLQESYDPDIIEAGPGTSLAWVKEKSSDDLNVQSFSKRM
ncbi:kinase-like domain-containing protein [Melampsora americana]|nr:kinase-like domain-containing protein [Melampsora americana]